MRSTVYAVRGRRGTVRVERRCGAAMKCACRSDSAAEASGRVRRTHRLAEDQTFVPAVVGGAATALGKPILLAQLVEEPKDLTEPLEVQSGEIEFALRR